MQSRYSEQQRTQCTVDADGNIVDPLYNEVILPERVITVAEPTTTPGVNVYYCFDIENLYMWVSQGNNTNPYTRNRLPQDILARVQE